LAGGRSRRGAAYRNPIDHADGGQDQQDDESDLVEIVGADLLRQLQPDPSGAGNDADDRRRQILDKLE
jgi:hypothetical protein